MAALTPDEVPFWPWGALLIAIAAYLVGVAALIAAGRREDARALAGFIPDCLVLVSRLAREQVTVPLMTTMSPAALTVPRESSVNETSIGTYSTVVTVKTRFPDAVVEVAVAVETVPPVVVPPVVDPVVVPVEVVAVVVPVVPPVVVPPVVLVPVVEVVVPVVVVPVVVPPSGWPVTWTYQVSPGDAVRAIGEVPLQPTSWSPSAVARYSVMFAG